MEIRIVKELQGWLGPMPKPVDLNPEIIHEITEDGLIKRKILIDLEAGMSAPIWLYVPVKALEKPAPAILCCHGHGPFGKEPVMGIKRIDHPELTANIAKCNYDYGLQMAQAGFVTLAIDWRGFGQRSDVNLSTGTDPCNVDYVKATLLGYTTMALNIFDGMRCIDYLSSLDFVNSDNIGCMGLSFGGTMTTWLSIIDERIKAADVICYSARYGEFALKRNSFCGAQIIPGLYGLCDLPDLQGLIAPRPLLAEIGLLDTCFKSDEALSCAHEVEKIYTAAGVEELYETDIVNGGHCFAGNKAFGFFKKHLNS